MTDSSPQPAGKPPTQPAPPPRPGPPPPEPEVGGRHGPEPTRYGDWERKGICVDF